MRRYVAEGLGTFVLVLGGVGTAVLAGNVVGRLGVALAFGLSLLLLVYVIGPVSGCHVNPAVTLGLLVARRIEPVHAAVYVVAQCAGGILAAATIWLVASTQANGYSPDAGPVPLSPGAPWLGANGYGAHSVFGFSQGGAFLIEVLLTGLLVFVVLGATDVRAPQGFAGIAIGFTLALVHLIAIPIDNTSVNPARSLGPAVFVGDWALSQLWLFIVAPLVGAVLAAGAHLALFPGPVVSTSTAESALPAESLTRLAQETARLIRSAAE